jgi:uncharacterized coiled-coil protein SlyX
MCPPNETEETEEIDVTKIVERLDALEKENSDQKAKIQTLEKTLDVYGRSIDRIADLVARG